MTKQSDDWRDNCNGDSKPIRKRKTYRVHHRTSSFAIVALIMGIIGISLLAIIFGALGMNDARKPGVSGYGMAVTGLILGIIWAIASVVIYVLAVAVSS